MLLLTYLLMTIAGVGYICKQIATNNFIRLCLLLGIWCMFAWQQLPNEQAVSSRILRASGHWATPSVVSVCSRRTIRSASWSQADDAACRTVDCSTC